MNKEETPICNFTPINFPDGSSYTAQEVEWVCTDYLMQAEHSIAKKRKRSRYTQEWINSGKDVKKMDQDIRYGTEITPMDQRSLFIQEVKKNKDYEWIVAVALARNEIDSMHSLRIRAYSKDTITGKSMVDRMMDRYIDICTNGDLSYPEMAKARFLRTEIELLSKKGTPQVGTIVYNNINSPLHEKAKKELERKIFDVEPIPVKGLKRVKDTEAVEQ